MTSNRSGSASAFLDEHLTASTDAWSEGDYLRFYMATAWIAQRADMESAYATIFRRLRACRGDWVYHFPRLYLGDLGSLPEPQEQRGPYSPNRWHDSG